MNSSSGFNNSSLMGNSTGFKKRNLLRPASGMLSKKLQFLRAIDVSQSEPVIATFLKGQIAGIEEEINLLDKDRRLRQGQTGLRKGYITALRKWLQNNQTFPEREDEDIKVLKYLGVDNYQSGFRKLWKVLGHLDLTISKVTELQVIHFLLYDQMFDDIGKDSHRSSSLLSQISNNSYSPCSFQITQILMDRAKDVYATCRKNQGKGDPKVQEDRKSREETNQLISQLKVENAKLNAMLEELAREKETEKKKLTEKETTKTAKENQSPALDKSSTSQHLSEIQDKFQEHIKFLNSQKTHAQLTVNQLKAKVSILEAQLKAAAEKVPSVSFPSVSSGSYEEALMEEMEKMKRGFERKIAILTEEFTQKERDLRKKEVDYKTQNQKIKWEKSLLLKKFDLIAK